MEIRRFIDWSDTGQYDHPESEITADRYQGSYEPVGLDLVGDPFSLNDAQELGQLNLYDDGRYDIRTSTTITFAQLTSSHLYKREVISGCLLYTSPSPRDS